MTYNSQRTEKLEKDLIELQSKIVNEKNELHNICKSCENEKNTLELKYNNLQRKKKKLAESGDIQNLMKIDHQNYKELKTLMARIEQQETILKNLENEKKKLSEMDKPYFLEKSNFAKEITGIKWTSKCRNMQGFIENKQNSYLKYFSIKNDGNTDVTEQLYKEIQNSAFTDWDNFVNEA